PDRLVVRQPLPGRRAEPPQAALPGLPRLRLARRRAGPRPQPRRRRGGRAPVHRRGAATGRAPPGRRRHGPPHPLRPPPLGARAARTTPHGPLPTDDTEPSIMRRPRPGALRATLFAALLLLPAPARAAGEVEYNRDVRPILVENCFACHGTDSAART